MKTTSRRLLHACSLMTLCAAPLLASAQTPAPPAAAAPTPAPLSDDQAYYDIGVNFGQSLQQLGVGKQELDTISRGIRDGVGGRKLEAAEQRNLQAYIRTATEAMAQRNAQAGKDFLAKNGHEKGVVTTASGLEYRILVPGNTKAASPAATDVATVQYRGTFLDGTEFDSSYARNQPAEFPVDHVIKGWTEALQLMKPGAKWKLWIPAELAYGDRPRPGIPAGSMLTFEVELLSFKPAPPPAPPAPRAAPNGAPAPVMTPAPAPK